MTCDIENIPFPNKELEIVSLSVINLIFMIEDKEICLTDKERIMFCKSES